MLWIRFIFNWIRIRGSWNYGSRSRLNWTFLRCLKNVNFFLFFSIKNIYFSKLWFFSRDFLVILVDFYVNFQRFLRSRSVLWSGSGTSQKKHIRIRILDSEWYIFNYNSTQHLDNCPHHIIQCKQYNHNINSNSIRECVRNLPNGHTRYKKEKKFTFLSLIRRFRAYFWRPHY